MNLNKAVLCIGLSLLTTICFAQTKDHHWGVAFGGGPQDYISNLGNGFKISSESSWHGAGILQVGNYVNPSLDLVFFGSIGDLSASRLKSVGLCLKYKFANGYLLDESNALNPYVYAGAAFNNLSDRVNMGKVPEANYLSLNAGLGLRYYLFWRLAIGYNLAIGGFLVDGNDIDALGGSNEIYLHNALMLSVDL